MTRTYNSLSQTVQTVSLAWNDDRQTDRQTDRSQLLPIVRGGSLYVRI